MADSVLLSLLTHAQAWTVDSERERERASDNPSSTQAWCHTQSRPALSCKTLFQHPRTQPHSGVQKSTSRRSNKGKRGGRGKKKDLLAQLDKHPVTILNNTQLTSAPSGWVLNTTHMSNRHHVRSRLYSGVCWWSRNVCVCVCVFSTISTVSWAFTFVRGVGYRAHKK